MKKKFPIVLFTVMISSLFILLSFCSCEKDPRTKEQKVAFQTAVQNKNYSSLKEGVRGMAYIHKTADFYYGLPMEPENLILEIPSRSFVEVLGMNKEEGYFYSYYHIRYNGIEGFIRVAQSEFYDIDKHLSRIKDREPDASFFYLTTVPTPVYQFPMTESPVVLLTLPIGYVFNSSQTIENSDNHHGEGFKSIDLETGERGIVSEYDLEFMIIYDDGIIGTPSGKHKPNPCIILENTPVFNSDKNQYKEIITSYKRGDIIYKCGLSGEGGDVNYFIISLKNKFNLEDQFGFIPVEYPVAIIQEVNINTVAKKSFLILNLPDSNKVFGEIPAKGIVRILGFIYLYNENDNPLNDFRYIEYEGIRGYIRAPGDLETHFILE